MSQLFKSFVFISLLTSGLCMSNELSTSTQATKSQKSAESSPHKNLIQEFFKAYSDNNSLTLTSLMAKDYTMINASDIHEISYNKYSEMSKNIKVRISAMHKALPDFSLDVKEIFSDGDKVFARSVISGIQKGRFLGTAPTNKPIHIHIYSVFTIKDGKIEQISEMWNELSIMKQLGCVVL